MRNLVIENNEQVEILGTLYKNERGGIMLINDHGLHEVLLEPPEDGMCSRAESLTYTISHEVNWGDGALEIWATEIWDDLREDVREEQGNDGAEEMSSHIVTTFPSVILSG